LSSSATLQVAVTTRLDTPVAWTLDNLQNRPLLPGTAITLQFLQGSIAGFAGCNTYNANYEVTPNDDGSYSVTVTNLTTSKLACPQNIMDQEAYYLTFLETVTRAQLELNILTLSYPAGVGPNNNPYPEGVLKFYEIGTR
jgi:heat shock protein HslJ